MNLAAPVGVADLAPPFGVVDLTPTVGVVDPAPPVGVVGVSCQCALRITFPCRPTQADADELHRLGHDDGDAAGPRARRRLHGRHRPDGPGPQRQFHVGRRAREAPAQAEGDGRVPAALPGGVRPLQDLSTQGRAFLRATG